MNLFYAIFRFIARYSLAPLLLLLLVFEPQVKAQAEAAPQPQPSLEESDSTQRSVPEPAQEIHSPTSAVPASARLQGGFLKRFYKTYAQELHETGTNEPEPPRRIPPSPLDSPPFPSADWTYGGTSVIGATNTTNFPLMRALYAGPHGDAWKASGVQIYGWIDPGFNLSTSKHSNLPAGYDIMANRLELDQFVTYIERVPDTVQTDHMDWGFRAANFFGIDYHFTTAKGWLSQQLVEQHRLYGDDPVNLYGDIYFPKLAQGLNVRFGRYISLPDIEAQLSPQNYTYTHSLLYNYDPFTQTGVIGSVKLNDKWLVSLGINGGNDIAVWARGAKPSLTACVSYTFNKGKDNIYPCASGINTGKYAYNNVQLYVNTWYHKFNDSWHMATEGYYEYQRDVPSIFGSLPTEPNANGAYCALGQQRCFAPAWAAVNYLQKQFSKKDYISIRNEFLDDSKGQRTGFKTWYTEHTFMWGLWISDVITVRPELRFERAYNMPAYDLGTKKNQFSFAVDLIVRY